MEFISLSSLITMGIVVFILIVYRYLDKNNRSLEKVKRFTDKVKDNLSGFVEDKTQEIRNLSIDMQVNLKTAKEILKRIGDIEVELKNKAKSMETLHSKVNEYDTLIQELNNTTIAVEENLKRIHDESGFIDKIGRRMKIAQTKLDQLEKNIPSILEEIKRKNYGDLEDIRNSLIEDITLKMKIIQEEAQGAEARVKDFSVYLTRLEGRRDSMEKEMVKKFDTACKGFETRMLQKKAQVARSFKEELSGYLQEVNTKRDKFMQSMDELVQGSLIEITDLEDRMLKHLIEYKKDIEQAELNFKQNISKVVEAGKDLEHDIFTELRDKIKQDAQKVHGEVDRRLTQFAREVEARNNEIITILGKSKQNTEVWKTGIVKRIEKLKNDLNVHFVNSKAEIEARIAGFIQTSEDTQKVFEAQLNEFVETSTNKMQILDIDFSKKIEDMNQEFSVFKSDYTRHLNDIDDRVEGEKEQILLTFDEKMKNLEKQCAVRFEQVKSDFEKINGLGDDIQFRIKNIKKDLQECSCDLLGRIDEFKNKFSDDLTIASGEVEAVVMNNVEQRIAEYETNTTYRFDKLEKVQTDIDLLEQGLRELMEVKKDDVKKDFARFIKQLEVRKKEEREYTINVLKEIRGEIQKLDEEVNGLKAKAYENVSEKLKILEDEFFADLRERNEAMTHTVNEWQSSVQEKLDSIEDQHEKERLNLEEQYNKELQTGISALTEKTETMFCEFDQKWQERLSAELGSSTQQFNQITGEYKEEVKNIIREIEDNFSTQRDNISSDIETYREEVKDIISQVLHTFTSQRDKVNMDIEKYSEEIQNKILEMEGSFSSQYESANTKIGKMKEELENTIREIEDDLTVQRETAGMHMSKYKEVVKNTILGIQDDFASHRETVNMNIESYKEEVKNTILGIQGDFTTQRQQVSDNIEKYKGTVKNTIREIEEQFASQRDSLILETEEERKTLKAEINSCNHRLEIFEKRFTEKTGTVMNAFQSEYKQKLKDFTGRLRELQGEFELKIKEFKASISEGTTFVSNTQKEQKNEIKTMEEKVKTLNKQLKEMAEKAITSCNNEYQQLKEDFYNQSKEFADTMEKKISGFENIFKLDQEKIKQAHNKLSAKIAEQYKALAEDLKEIERQQKSFKAQTKLFERADSLKLTLKNELEDLRKDMKLLEPARKKMKTLEVELTKMNKLTEDLNSKTSRYNAEKRRIDSIEHNFKQLIKVSDSIDEKLAGAESAYDTLQDIKIKLRELGELSNDVQSRYERLEKKKEIIETTTIGVDKNFKILEDLEKEIKRIEENVESLPPQILSIGQEVKYLVKNKTRADHAVDKMQKLNTMMTDIEERTQKLHSARDWLARTETRLESIGKSARDQLKLLQALMKDDGSNGKKSKGAPQQDKREMIVKLARQGWSAKEISKATNTSVGEVELILELEPKKR